MLYFVGIRNVGPSTKMSKCVKKTYHNQNYKFDCRNYYGLNIWSVHQACLFEHLVPGCRVICRVCDTLGTRYLVVRCELWSPLTTEQQGPVSDSWWTTAIWPATLWSCKHTLVHPCLMLLHSPHDELEYPEKVNPKYTPPPIICWRLLCCQSIGKVWKPSLKWLTWLRKTGRRSQVEVKGTRDTLETGLFWYLLETA